MKLNDVVLVFCVIVVLMIGDFISFRIFIPKMISAQNDILVFLGFFWATLLGAVHWFLIVWCFNRDKIEK